MRRPLSRFGASFFFLIVLIASIVMLNVVSRSQHNDWPITTGVIQKIDHEVHYGANNDREDDYHVYVKYNVNGKDYDEELGYYTGEYREGMELEIRYDPENPMNITAADISSMLRYFKILIPVSAVLMVLTAAWTILRGHR